MCCGLVLGSGSRCELIDVVLVVDVMVVLQVFIGKDEVFELLVVLVVVCCVGVLVVICSVMCVEVLFIVSSGQIELLMGEVLFVQLVMVCMIVWLLLLIFIYVVWMLVLVVVVFEGVVVDIGVELDDELLQFVIMVVVVSVVRESIVNMVCFCCIGVNIDWNFIVLFLFFVVRNG